MQQHVARQPERERQYVVPRPKTRDGRCTLSYALAKSTNSRQAPARGTAMRGGRAYPPRGRGSGLALRAADRQRTRCTRGRKQSSAVHRILRLMDQQAECLGAARAAASKSHC